MEQLLDSGIPLDEEVVSELRASCQGPSLYQTGSPVENELFDLQFGGFGLLVSIAICNDSPKTIHISRYVSSHHGRKQVFAGSTIRGKRLLANARIPSRSMGLRDLSASAYSTIRSVGMVVSYRTIASRGCFAAQVKRPSRTNIITVSVFRFG